MAGERRLGRPLPRGLDQRRLVRTGALKCVDLIDAGKHASACRIVGEPGAIEGGEDRPAIDLVGRSVGQDDVVGHHCIGPWNVAYVPVEGAVVLDRSDVHPLAKGALRPARCRREVCLAGYAWTAAATGIVDHDQASHLAGLSPDDLVPGGCRERRPGAEARTEC